MASRKNRIKMNKKIDDLYRRIGQLTRENDLLKGL